MNKNILLAGTAGFIGSNFVPYFLEMGLQSHQKAETKVSVPSRNSYKELITFVEERAGHDKRYAIDAEKLETQLGWKANETFDTGIIKTVERYLNKYGINR
jgi:dTDP-glucose 4,6-dehydratase